jgi:hypothetical protein
MNNKQYIENVETKKGKQFSGLIDDDELNEQDVLGQPH